MTGIIFIARLGSTRLANKHLIEVNGKTFIEWLIARYVNEFESEIQNNNIKLILATSHKPENKKFEAVLDHLPVSVFYGNDDNIPLRQIECADNYKLENIISIDGDDILCSTKAARLTYESLIKDKGKIVKTTGLALGMNVMGYSADLLKSSINSANKLETGWGRIFDNVSVHEINLGEYSKNNDLRLTLDYDLDAEFFKAVISFLKERTISINDEDLIKIILEQRFFEINRSLTEAYWKNFNKEKNSEPG